MIKVYRIRLVGTELYYQPATGRFAGEKSNLSLRGKVYLKSPPVPDKCCYISEHLARSEALCNRCSTQHHSGRQQFLDDAQWEIVEYVAEEVAP